MCSHHSLYRSDFYHHPLNSSQAVQFEQSVEQHVCAVCDVFRTGKFAGEWLKPATLGMKIMPTGPSRAMSCASWPAPEGSSFVVRPSSRAASEINERICGSVGAGMLMLISLNSNLVLLS